MKKILLVEDEELLREAYEFLLQQHGYNVTAAPDGREALKALKAMGSAPDLILLDLLMPHMDGLEFLKTVDVEKTMPKTIVIVLSNLSNAAKSGQLLRHGARKIVLKAELGSRAIIDMVDDELGHTNNQAGSKATRQTGRIS